MRFQRERARTKETQRRIDRLAGRVERNGRRGRESTILEKIEGIARRSESTRPGETVQRSYASAERSPDALPKLLPHCEAEILRTSEETTHQFDGNAGAASRLVHKEVMTYSDPNEASSKHHRPGHDAKTSDQSAAGIFVCQRRQRPIAPRQLEEKSLQERGGIRERMLAHLGHSPR